MKKLLSFLSAICLIAVLTSCGGSKWDQERAQQLNNKEFETLTAEDFDEMLVLIDAGWEKRKKNPNQKTRTTAKPTRTANSAVFG